MLVDTLGASEAIGIEDALIVRSPRVGLDREGNAVAVWSQEPGQSTVFNIYSSRLDALE